MFRIIAIKPLKGCGKHVLKCLKENQMYYLCNDFCIVDNGICYRQDHVRLLSDDFYRTDKRNERPDISVSAIVGKNGDGKSSLVELMVRLINNCACSYEMNPRKNLLRVEGVKAELYYQSGNTIFRMKEEQGMVNTEVHEIAEIHDGIIRNFEPKTVSVERLKDDFFYTLVSNYSHYAFNVNDFNDEKDYSVDSKDEEDKYWLHRVFHKNDGYQTPISIHPYREYGNIDVNREKELSDQRMLSVIMSSKFKSDKEGGYLGVIEKRPCDIEMTLTKGTKLREKTIKEHFQGLKDVFMLREQIDDLNNYMKGGEQAKQLLDELLYLMEALAKRFRNLRTRRGLGPYIVEAIRLVIGDNREYYLAEATDIGRLLSILNLLGKQNVEAERIKKVVKLYQEVRILSFAQLQWLILIDNVIDYWKKGVDINGMQVGFELDPMSLSCNEEKLDIKTKCEHYIVYKTISIFETYPKYSQNMWMIKNFPMVYGVKSSDTIYNEIINDGFVFLVSDCLEKSHITLKLRQTLRFYKDYLGDRCAYYDQSVSEPKLEEGLEDEARIVHIDKLREKYGREFENLEMMPPRIFTWDIVFKTKDEKKIKYHLFSSGEKQLIQVLSAILYHVKNIDSIASTEMRYRNVNLVFDEIELYFHPEWQRFWVYCIIRMLRSVEYDYVRLVNVILVTHSPFVLSDVPKTNVLFLTEGIPNYDMQMNTFGANIHSLLKNGFFLPGLPMGEFAHKKIDSLFARLNEGSFPIDDLDSIYNDIMQVGEPVLRNELLTLYNGYRSLQANDEKVERILAKILQKRMGGLL